MQNKSRTSLACAMFFGALISGNAWAQDCNVVGQEVKALLDNPGAAVTDEDYVRAEDLYGQGTNQCENGDNAQAVVLLDEAKSLLGG